MSNQSNDQSEVLWVIKSTGERERFSLNKLRRSLTRSGADDETIERIVEHIIPELHEGMKTSQLYKHAYSILKKSKYPAAIRYSLRKAVLELGPSGFPFEKFVAEVLRGKGYTAETGVILQGFCVDHEVDVLMQKGDRHIFAECKFHNQQGIKTDVKVALYVNARFMDLQKAHDEAHKRHEGEVKKVHEGWLITNTKLTSDAIEYANCSGLTVIGWDYPEKGNLQALILETGVHPLTFLSTLTQGDKNSLLEKGIVMCRELKNSPVALKSIGFTDEQIGKVVEEVDQVCQEF